MDFISVSLTSEAYCSVGVIIELASLSLWLLLFDKLNRVIK